MSHLFNYSVCSIWLKVLAFICCICLLSWAVDFFFLDTVNLEFIQVVEFWTVLFCSFQKWNSNCTMWCKDCSITFQSSESEMLKSALILGGDWCFLWGCLSLFSILQFFPSLQRVCMSNEQLGEVHHHIGVNSNVCT